MPVIPGFPDDLLDQHHHWHNPAAHPGAGPGRTHAAGTPGGGLEFLTFHRNFTAQVLAWYNATTFPNAPFSDAAQKAQLVLPWTAVPSELQALGDWSTWAGDAARLDSGSPDFLSADELGTFIEVGIHNNFLHGGSAIAFNEPEVATLHSPQVSTFYKIHGLVDHWWSLWQRRHKRRIKELMKEVTIDVDIKRFLAEVKDLRPEIKDRIGEVKHLGDEVKTVGREAIENPAEILVDPAVRAVNQRLAQLERAAFPTRATFIESSERPDVGAAVAEQLEHGHDGGHHDG